MVIVLLLRCLVCGCGLLREFVSLLVCFVCVLDFIVICLLAYLMLFGCLFISVLWLDLLFPGLQLVSFASFGLFVLRLLFVGYLGYLFLTACFVVCYFVVVLTCISVCDA